MRCFWYIICFCTLQSDAWSDNKQRKFRSDFKFGVSTSAYQIEGAWNVDGKGESIWDKYVRDHPEAIKDGRNGDVACDSYHNYKRDVEMLRELGVDHYRFSISWSRILPSGLPNNKSEQGLLYYDRLIDELLKHKIAPMVTLYHYDLPQNLQRLGGWANPLSATWFQDYARVVFERYGGRVRYWVTLDQPHSICMHGYGAALMPPALDSAGAEYLCAKNVLLAHAYTYRMYEREFRDKHRGSVGISLSLNWADPADNSTEALEATERFREFHIDLFLHPIWSKAGDFPPNVKRIVAKRSKAQGFFGSRLPALSPEEIKLLKGSADFLGVNHYTTFLVKPSARFHGAAFDGDVAADVQFGEKWERAQSPWLRSAPYGLYKLCLYLNKRYDYPTVFFTEQGWSTGTGLLDRSRVKNLREYLKALLLAIEDGTEVLGFTVWSLMDNVEWNAGTSERFGLYEVDFDSEEKTRRPRMSALVYKRIIEKRIIDDWEPKDLNISPRKRIEL
ncbi:unnamed protein product, partial [Iphiclides podalirius]